MTPAQTTTAALVPFRAWIESVISRVRLLSMEIARVTPPILPVADQRRHVAPNRKPRPATIASVV